MANRGEDASRTQADWGGQPPWGDQRPGSDSRPGSDQRRGGYKGQDAGNDWYGGPPAAASGASFADTGTYTLSGRIGDEYGTGPSRPPRDPVHGYPRSSGQQSPPYTGQQERYDDYGPRTGPGPAAYDNPAGNHGGPGNHGGRRRSGGRHPLLLAAGAVVAVVIVGVAAYVFLVKPRPAASSHATAGPLPAPGSAPSTQACVKQYGTYCHIEDSTDDPAPLTISELFPPAFTNETDKNSFSLVSTKLDKTCSNAVIGQALISALKAGKCTQVVRASYVSGNGTFMGTIGVVNLATTNEAHYAGRVVGQSDFIAPLAAAKGVAKKLGQGTGVVEAEFKGHYLILTWLEFTNGTTPATKAQDSQLEQFGNDLVAGTANIPLSQRMVTGTPATSGAASP